MTFEEFQDSLRHDAPPKALSLGLTALWWDGKGDWTKAHASAQEDEGAAGAWVHTYLKVMPRTLRTGTEGRASLIRKNR